MPPTLSPTPPFPPPDPPAGQSSPLSRGVCLGVAAVGPLHWSTADTEWHVLLPSTWPVLMLLRLPTSPPRASSPRAWHPWVDPGCHAPCGRHLFHPLTPRAGNRSVPGTSGTTSALRVVSGDAPAKGSTRGSHAPDHPRWPPATSWKQNRRCALGRELTPDCRWVRVVPCEPSSGVRNRRQSRVTVGAH